VIIFEIKIENKIVLKIIDLFVLQIAAIVYDCFILECICSNAVKNMDFLKNSFSNIGHMDEFGG
jgi:hypothetical protein